MSRHLAIFLLCFAVGAALTLIVRTIRHQPYAAPQMAPRTMAPNPMATDQP